MPETKILYNVDFRVELPEDVRKKASIYAKCVDKCYHPDPVDPDIDEECVHKCLAEHSLDVEEAERASELVAAVEDVARACSGTYENPDEALKCVDEKVRSMGFDPSLEELVRKALRPSVDRVEVTRYRWGEVPEDVRARISRYVESKLDEVREFEALTVFRKGGETHVEVEVVVDDYDEYGIEYRGFRLLSVILPQRLAREVLKALKLSC